MKMDWVKKWKPKRDISLTLGVALYEWGLPAQFYVHGSPDREDEDFALCLTVLCFYFEVCWWWKHPPDLASV